MRLDTDWQERFMELDIPAVPLQRQEPQESGQESGQEGEQHGERQALPAVPLKRYTGVITNNNASNYSIANAFDMQELLGLTVAGGEAIPESVAQTQATRATDADDSQS